MKRRSRKLTNVLLFVSLAWIPAIGCQRTESPVAVQETEAPVTTVSIVEGQTPSDEQKQAMLAAKDALFETLSGRLMEAMGRGPAQAITICKKEATVIAEQVGQDHGLKIGRTGVRLRNPDNQPPGWAEPMTSSGVDTPQFLMLDNGDAAALLPIRLKSQCLMCHGPAEQIAPIIGDQLAKLYPNDQATGFQEGELRGWFWIEKPAG